MACDMPGPCTFPSLDTCQKRFLWTHKEVALAPHPVVGLVHQVGDEEKFLHALGFEILDPSFSESSILNKPENNNYSIDFTEPEASNHSDLPSGKSADSQLYGAGSQQSRKQSYRAGSQQSLNLTAPWSTQEASHQ